MVYDVLENQRVLSRLYSVLFNLLDTIAIRYAPFDASESNAHYLIPDPNYVTCYP
jgi:hypothetical protein